MPYALGDTSTDARAAYVAWAAAVKRAGGTVSHAPHLTAELVSDPMSGDIVGGGGSLIAAQYPVKTVFPNAPATTLAPAFSKLPDDWSDNGAFVFYVAPPAVQAYTDPITGDITTPQAVPGETPPPNPQWYDNFLKYARYGAYGLGAIILLDLLSFLPRRRNPPRRRRRR